MQHKSDSSTLKPLPIAKALFYFGLPALFVRLVLYQGIPVMLALGLSQFEAAIVSVAVPNAILFVLAFVLTTGEGISLRWSNLADRWRLRRMDRTAWFWTIGGLVVAIAGTGLLAPTAVMLIEAIPAITPPASFPMLFDPRVQITPGVLEEMVGAPLLGNWTIVILQSIAFFFNIAGEELWWRGVIMPRQELVHGRWTWLIHGLLWLGFHLLFYPWAIFSLLLPCLVIAFVTQHTQNTWPAIIIHSIANGIPLIGFIGFASGLIG